MKLLIYEVHISVEAVGYLPSKCDPPDSQCTVTLYNTYKYVFASRIVLVPDVLHIKLSLQVVDSAHHAIPNALGTTITRLYKSLDCLSIHDADCLQWDLREWWGWVGASRCDTKIRHHVHLCGFGLPRVTNWRLYVHDTLAVGWEGNNCNVHHRTLSCSSPFQAQTYHPTSTSQVTG